MHTYHILNGDMLHGQFPAQLKDENQIVFREMLMDGPLSDILDVAFYKLRAAYIDGLAGEDSQYMEFVRPQIDQIKNLPDNSIAYLWFEQDLFCQVNFWSCVTWMSKYCEGLKMYLVEPPKADWKGFGGMAEADLCKAHEEARLLSDADIHDYKAAFKHYVAKDAAALSAFVAQEGLNRTIKEALLAEINRLPNGDGDVSLHQVIMDLHEAEGGDFGKIFQRFSKEYSVYGMGDFQFKLLFDKLLS